MFIALYDWYMYALLIQDEAQAVSKQGVLVRDGIYKEFDSWLVGRLVLDADSWEQGSGLDVLLLIGGLQQTQTPYLTGIGSVVSRVSGELLSVCGLQGVDSGGLDLIQQSALVLLFHS